MKRIIENEGIIENLNQRYACKIFDKDFKIREEDKEIIRKIISLTPTSYGLQLYKIVEVNDKDLREKLRPVSWNQSQTVDADMFLVFCILQDVSEEEIMLHLKNVQKTRGWDDEKLSKSLDFMKEKILSNGHIYGIKDKQEWMARQLYIVLGNLLTNLSLMGLDSVPMEGIEPEKYDEILNLKEKGLIAKCAVAIGKRSGEDKYKEEKKVRFPVEDFFIKM